MFQGVDYSSVTGLINNILLTGPCENQQNVEKYPNQSDWMQTRK
jgi:hypothetical protein